MKTFSVALALTALAGFVTPASASVAYELDAFLAGFSYTAPGLITTTTTVDGAAASYCGVLIASCQSISFSPGTEEGQTDDVTLNVVWPFWGFGLASTSMQDDEPEAMPFTYSFAQGSFGKVGKHSSLDGWSTLIVSDGVSAVPLPGSAALFGAALVAFGAAGLAGTRRKAAV